MAEITAASVKELRERTGAGMMDCKRALDESGGDVDKAIATLRERGLAAAAKKAGREAREGLISSYIHTGGRVGVLIEVNCETDFVARTEQFQQLVRNLAVQVAATYPRWVAVEDIPAHVADAKRAEILAAADVEGKPETVRESIATGRSFSCDARDSRAIVPPETRASQLLRKRLLMTTRSCTGSAYATTFESASTCQRIDAGCASCANFSATSRTIIERSSDCGRGAGGLAKSMQSPIMSRTR